MIRALILLLTLQAHATQAGCERELLPAGMAAYRKIWEGAMMEDFDRKEPLSGVEYEALMDINGGFVLTAFFENGESMTNFDGEENYFLFKHSLLQHRIVRTRFMPGSDQDLRELVFKPACMLLGLSGCEAYDSVDASERPFTAIQELALKWATYHVKPNRNAYVKMNEQAEKHDITFREMWSSTEAKRQQYSYTFLCDVFTHEQAHKLFTEFISPLLSANFEARVRQENRVKAH